MPPTYIATIAIAGMITFILMIWMIGRAETAKAKAKGGTDADRERLERIIAETSTEVARLRDRVQVLEKLVTDEDRNLANEIERLRRDRGDDTRG
jgi:Phage shock protein B